MAVNVWLWSFLFALKSANVHNFDKTLTKYLALQFCVFVCHLLVGGGGLSIATKTSWQRLGKRHSHGWKNQHWLVFREEDGQSPHPAPAALHAEKMTTTVCRCVGWLCSLKRCQVVYFSNSHPKELAVSAFASLDAYVFSRRCVWSAHWAVMCQTGFWFCRYPLSTTI